MNEYNELIFKNLIVRYDNNTLSKKKMRKMKFISVMSTGIGIILFFVIFGFITMNIGMDDNYMLKTFILTFFMIAIIFGLGVLIELIYDKITPRYYEFIRCLMKFKTNEIEIGLLNNRYVVSKWNPRCGWLVSSLNAFINEEYDLEENCDKAQSIKVLIDLTQEKIKVTVNNQ